MYALLLVTDPEERAVLSLVLQRAGLAVTAGTDLERALRVWPDRPADVIVLALSSDPISDVRHIRSETTVPIVVIADPMNEDSHYHLLEGGADMVILRPFSARLLIGQMRALSRRAGGIPVGTLPKMTVGDLTLDLSTRSVNLAEQPPRRLTHLEFRLLFTLMIHRDQILSTETIVDQVWGYNGDGDKDLVRGLIHRLRLKIERDPSKPQYILTVPGLGYSFSNGEV